MATFVSTIAPPETPGRAEKGAKRVTLTPCHELHRHRRTVKLILFVIILIDLQNDTHDGT